MADTPGRRTTFIPYVAKGQKTLRARELLQSSAKSHAAQVAHQKRKQKARRYSDTDFPSPLTINDESVSPVSSPGSTNTPLSPEPPILLTAETALTSSVSPSSIVQSRQDQDAVRFPPQQQLIRSGVRRGIDWYFGSNSFSCRPLSELDNAAIHYFLHHGPEQWPGANLSGNSLVVSHGNLPVSEQLVRLAMQEQPLLDSVIAYTAFNMLNEHPDTQVLIHLGHKASEAALRAMRKALTAPDSFRSLVLPYAVLHLCMASISMGQPDAARVHLEFLANATRHIVPRNEFEYRLMFQIRGIDLRYALQSGQLPITSAYWKAMQQAQRPRSYIRAEDTTGQFDLPTPPGTPLIEEEASHICPTPTSESHWQVSDVLSQTESNQSGFHNAVQEGLLSPSLCHIVDLYLDAIAYLSKLSREPDIGTPERIRAREKCYTCLDQLCTQWHFRHRHQVMSASSSNRSQSHTVIGGQDLHPGRAMDDAVILAFQIHLIICQGRYSGYTLVVLCERLRLYLQKSRLFESSETREGSASFNNLQDKLLLWVLLLGMLAAVGRSDDFDWMRSCAVQFAGRILVESDVDLLRALAPCSPRGCPPGDDFVRIVRKLMSYVVAVNDAG